MILLVSAVETCMFTPLATVCSSCKHAYVNYSYYYLFK